MPFNFGKKRDNEKEQTSTPVDDSIQPLDDKDYQVIAKIKEMLNPDEHVILVAQQSRILPGGSYLTPNTIYATNRRLIVRDPYLLGSFDGILYTCCICWRT